MFTGTGSILALVTGIYFGKDGDRLVILVGGGTKKRQQDDIPTALRFGDRTTSNEKQQKGDSNGLDS